MEIHETRHVVKNPCLCRARNWRVFWSEKMVMVQFPLCVLSVLCGFYSKSFFFRALQRSGGVEASNHETSVYFMVYVGMYFNEWISCVRHLIHIESYPIASNYIQVHPIITECPNINVIMLKERLAFLVSDALRFSYTNGQFRTAVFAGYWKSSMNKNVSAPHDFDPSEVEVNWDHYGLFNEHHKSVIPPT